MALNTSHAGNLGVLIHTEEQILLYCQNITIEFSEHEATIFQRPKDGSIYLTSHRMIFISVNSPDELKSFSFPFLYLNEIQVEEPMYDVSCVRGTVRPHLHSNFLGTIRFKIVINSGGTNEFAQALLYAISLAQENVQHDAPRLFARPSDDWNEASESIYTSIPARFDWLPRTVFPDRPIAGTIFISDSLPAYAGIIPNDPPPRYEDQVSRTNIQPNTSNNLQSNDPHTIWTAIYNEFNRINGNCRRIYTALFSINPPQYIDTGTDTMPNEMNILNSLPDDNEDPPPSYESIYRKQSQTQDRST